MHCPRLNCECMADSCAQKGKCVLDTSKPVVLARACPTFNNQECRTKWCLDNNMCISGKGPAHIACPLVGETLINFCMDKTCIETGVCQGMLEDQVSSVYSSGYSAGSWDCPSDKKPCSLLRCNGGQTCDIENKPLAPPVVKSEPCHEGIHAIGKIGKATLCCGREAAVKGWDFAKYPIGLLIGLLGDAWPQGNLVNMNEPAKAIGGDQLKVSTPVIPNIWIKWPDYSIVPFGRPFWDELVKLISDVDGLVVVYCFGGHGRTGTMVSILSALGGLVAAHECPVTWLRSVYCKEVVESEEQLEYIEKITGFTVQAKPAKVFSYKSYSSGGSYGSQTHYVPKEHRQKGSKKKTVGGLKSSNKPLKDGGLSKKKWKAWWRRQPRTGKYCGIASVTRPSDLPDGQTFEIHGKVWKWSSKEGEFLEA